MNIITQNQYLAILNGCGNDCSRSYCFFKTFLEKQHPSERLLIQLKCLEKMKWEESEKENHDIGLQEAGMRWCNDGWAKAFAQAYEEKENIEEIYTRTKQLIELAKNSPMNFSNEFQTVTTPALAM